MPVYPGATVVTRRDGFTMLRTGDSVARVGAFYVAALAGGGWQTISKYEGAYSVNIVARRDGEGVTVQVNPSGMGTHVSVTTYPV